MDTEDREKGGKARSAKLTPERRSEIARAGAAKRWAGDKAQQASAAPASIEPPGKQASEPAADWRKMTNKEREALPLGSEGWRYTRGTPLPKGQWIERLAVPEPAPNGAVVTSIRWGSNGVGLPSMILQGDTRGAHYHESGEIEVVPPKAYHPARDFTPRDMSGHNGPKPTGKGGKAA